MPLTRTSASDEAPADVSTRFPVNILIVDDDPRNLTALSVILQADDRCLVCVSSGEDALRQLLREEFAVVLLDVSMPGLDGFETAALIRGREQTRDMPIIFLTAAITGAAAIARGYALGAVDYLLKPFDPDVLQAKVAVFVELFRKTQETRQQAAQLARALEELRQAEAQRAELIREQVARAEAEAARDRLQQVLDVLPEGILIVEADGSISMVNAAGSELLGQLPRTSHVEVHARGEPRQANGTPIPPDEMPIARAVKHGEVVRGQQVQIRNLQRQEDVSLLVSAAPLRDGLGSVVGGVAVFQDISEIKELEQHKDSFLAAASHDLKNPLTAIKARAQLLERPALRVGGEDGAMLVEGLRGIDATARRLAAMINELLDVAHLQMGRPLDLDRQPLDLVELAREVAADLQPTSERHQLLVQTAGDPVQGELDRARLERALANLVTNAIKFSPHGGTVRLGVSRERHDGRDWGVLAVQDQGVGIPSAELPKVFERFYRGSNVAGRIEGSGLGLAGVRQIVEQHGGTVAIESQEGLGTTITLRLPLDPEPPVSGESLAS